VQWRADIGELRDVAARLNGSRVQEVRVPPGGDGRFGLKLALTRVRDDGTTRQLRRWLKVESVAWRLGGPNAVLAASGDSEVRLAVDLNVLTGRQVTSVDIRLPGWDTRIRFGEYLLTIFPVYHNEPQPIQVGELRVVTPPWSATWTVVMASASIAPTIRTATISSVSAFFSVRPVRSAVVVYGSIVTPCVRRIGHGCFGLVSRGAGNRPAFRMLTVSVAGIGTPALNGYQVKAAASWVQDPR
jgi:hypothetical protein